jgi:hypothetical protein
MKTFSASVMAAVALVVCAFPAVAEPLATWDTVINGPTRFKVLPGFNHAAVLDRETGLVWEQSPDTNTRTWVSAHIFCNDRAVGNRTRKGWRLPTVQEIASLVDATRFFPALPSNHPFGNVQSDFYWSATTLGADPGMAWGADFGGIVEGGARYTTKTSARLVWCVRSGHGGSEVQ